MLKRTVRAWNSSISGLRLRASSAFSKPPISVSSFVSKPCQDLRTTSSTAMIRLEALHTVLGLRLENSSNVGGTNKRVSWRELSRRERLAYTHATGEPTKGTSANFADTLPMELQ